MTNDGGNMKLIASDMDGTLLLHDSQQVSDRAIQLIQQLTEKGYLFVVASGRQYPNLKRQFKQVANDIAYICENGAVVLYKEHVLFESPMDHQVAMELCHDIYSHKGCEVLVSGRTVSYIKAKEPAFLDRMQNIVKNNVTVIENFEDIKEPIIKISVYEKDGIANSGDYFISQWEKRLKSTISGFSWLDFVNPDVNKGESLKHLMNLLSINKEDSIAFGDNFNDLEMLSCVGTGYVMNGANEKIKAMFTHFTDSVEHSLEQLLLSL